MSDRQPRTYDVRCRDESESTGVRFLTIEADYHETLDGMLRLLKDGIAVLVLPTSRLVSMTVDAGTAQ